MTQVSNNARFGSGQPVRRVEDDALLRGQGAFTDDCSLPDQAYVLFLRSPHAHARIEAIDTAAARALPGVLSIVTGRDLVHAGVKPIPTTREFKRLDGSPAQSPPYHALAVDTVRFAGEAVAAVVATTRDEARDALDAIEIRYAAIPAVVEMGEAIASGAPVVWPAASGNIACEARHGNQAAAEAAFGRARHVVTLDLVNQRVVPAPIEPRVVLAGYERDADRLTLQVSCQTPTGYRDELCKYVLGIPREKVRVLVGDIGGGFGMKTAVYPEDVVVAWLARELKRPLKWCAERLDDFLAASHGRDVQTRAQLALDAEGRILALRVDSLANMGAYATPAGAAIQLLIGPWVSTSIYDVATIDIRVQAVLTHTAPTGPYRGAGRPEAIYFLERLIEAAARQMGIDAVELRRRNMIRPEQMPYRSPMDKTYDSGQFESVMNQALELADWRGFDARCASAQARGRLRGRGMATYLEWTGAEIFEECVTVTVRGEGSIEIFSAMQNMGQSLATTFAQVAVDVFGVPIERIRVVMGDTDRVTGFGSAGSRSLFVGGSAVRVASERTVVKAQELAAEELEAAVADIEFCDGVFRIAGTDREVGLFALAAKQPSSRIVLDSTSKVAGPTWPNGCHICEVEIDPETGAIEVVGYWSVNDVGRVVNPMIVRGQIEGGAVQGIGQALCEQFVYDRESGQALSASFLDYTLPRAEMVRHFVTATDESSPCRNNAMGVKGVGELGTIGATPAVANAVVDALVRAGVGAKAEGLQMPFTSEKVWRALATAN